tara:strand:- start:5635 stop:5862 length:228 start_codon:yes stop_codon:yes gene_type:complete
MNEELTIKTEEGIGTGSTLTDIQQYNKRLGNLSKWVKLGVIVGGLLGFWGMTIFTWVIWKVIKDNVVNNIVHTCF